MRVPSKPASFPLAMAGEGETVRVEAILGGAAMARKVTEMGLNVGGELTVRQRQGGGLAVSRGAARLALGLAMAHRITVSRV